MEAEAEAKAVRLAVTVPATTRDALEKLATSARFLGNRSRAVAWCIDIGAVVLADPALADRLLPDAKAALRAFTVAKGRKG